MEEAAARTTKPPPPPPLVLALILNSKVFFFYLSLLLGGRSVGYALFTPLLFLTADIKSNEKVRAHISIARGEAGEI